jgi:hypothetical protein
MQGNIGRITSLLQAMIRGGKVSPGAQQQREEICRTCEYMRTEKGDGPEKGWCGICGCRVGAAHHRIINLTAYKENLPRWGCKHPNRLMGKGWPTLRK